MILDQIDVNIDNRKRRNALPWRGQFTPDLVDNLMSISASADVLDPFCGSGTVLQSAARNGALSATGLDINPAAILISQSAEIINKSIFERAINFSSFEEDLVDNIRRYSIEDTIKSLYIDSKHKDLVGILVCLADSADSDEITKHGLQKALKKLKSLMIEIPENQQIRISVNQADARFTGFNPNMYDLILTSPPYINVFNYHQNHRKKLERYLNILPLQIATSEIGANRKFRANRFKTIAQYIKDMYLFSLESHRILRDNGKIIMVVGRESNVLGIPFFNGEIVKSIFVESGLFRESSSVTRKFTNIFGDAIHEEIIVLNKSFNILTDPTVEILTHHIGRAMTNAKIENRQLLGEVLNTLDDIKPSQPFTNTNPN